MVRMPLFKTVDPVTTQDKVCVIISWQTEHYWVEWSNLVCYSLIQSKAPSSGEVVCVFIISSTTENT